MDNKLITIVVPVFKVEQYIQKCLDSLILPDRWMDRQEVLVVNDGTPDRSADMAREYEIRYPGVFRVIDKENGGHGSAWNRGVQEAKGKYLRFLDSDDWFTTTEYVKLLERLDGMDMDIVISDYNRYFVQREELEPMRVDTLPPDTALDAAVLNWKDQPWEIASFWRCTYKTAMLQREQPLFVERVFYDDIILQIAPVTFAREVCYLPFTVYNYLIGRPGQTMNPENQRKNYLHKFTVQKKVFDFYLSHPVDGEDRNAYFQMKIQRWLMVQFYQLSRFPYASSKKYLKEWKAYYLSLCNKVGFKEYPLNSIRFYFTLPFPFFYYGRLLKDTLTGGEKGIGIDSWAQ